MLQSNKLSLASILSFSLNILKEFASYTSIHGLGKLVDDFNYLNRSSAQTSLSKRLEKMRENHGNLCISLAFLIIHI